MFVVGGIFDIENRAVCQLTRFLRNSKIRSFFLGSDLGGQFENIFCAEQSTFAFDGLSACSAALQSNEIYLIFRSGYIDLTRL